MRFVCGIVGVMVLLHLFCPSAPAANGISSSMPFPLSFPTVIEITRVICNFLCVRCWSHVCILARHLFGRSETKKLQLRFCPYFVFPSGPKLVPNAHSQLSRHILRPHCSLEIIVPDLLSV